MSYHNHFYNVFLCSIVSDIEDEEGNAVLEEQEALKLQKQMAEQLDDQDFGLEMFQVGRDTYSSLFAATLVRGWNTISSKLITEVDS